MTGRLCATVVVTSATLALSWAGPTVDTAGRYWSGPEVAAVVTTAAGNPLPLGIPAPRVDAALTTTLEDQ